MTNKTFKNVIEDSSVYAHKDGVNEFIHISSLLIDGKSIREWFQEYKILKHELSVIKDILKNCIVIKPDGDKLAVKLNGNEIVDVAEFNKIIDNQRIPKDITSGFYKLENGVIVLNYAKLIEKGLI